MPTGWINDALRALPGTDDALFQKLWHEQRLLFDGKQGVGDTVDECSARLIVAALAQGNSLLVTLPDFQPHRPAFLFASALIQHVLAGTPRNDPVFYFGSAVGIRDQLRRTSVLRLRLSLAQLFEQRDIRRGAAALDSYRGTARVPRVMTIYSPADPTAIVAAHRIAWIAIDCGDAPSLVWLRPLLEEASRRRVPVVAWGQNPLSECVRDFAADGLSFTWPPTIQMRGHSPCRLSGDPGLLLQAHGNSHLLPLVLHGESVDSFSNALRSASQALGRVAHCFGGRFERDALSVHWRYLRAMEMLSVPLDFYEAEAPQFWGLRSLNQLCTTSDHFRNACVNSNSDLHGELESIGALLRQAKASLGTQSCPLWETLGYLWMEEAEDNEVRILVFPTDSRKRLFLFAMVARHNLTEDDLRENGTYVASLNEVHRWMYAQHTLCEIANRDDSLIPPEDRTWRPVVVGLPSPAMTPRLLSVLLHPKVDIVLYPHQCSSFMRRQGDWSIRLTGGSGRNFNVLADMSGLPVPAHLPPIPAGITVDDPVEVDVETVSKTKASVTDALWQPEDAISEVARLFQADEEFTAEELIFSEPAEPASTDVETPEDIWCAEAIAVQFDQGWHAHFAPDDTINVVQNGKADHRYVRALRVGERVLLIHGQQRQSLYDLIISRVHKHPSIELHLTMIRRWQEDLRVAFQQWQTRAPGVAERVEHGPRDLSGLLRRMQALGSQLVSTLTVSFWLRGFVLCPLDPDDLRRVAEVLDMGFVRQYHQRIIQAANRLRGLHRGLSIKLNYWLENHATGTGHKNDDDVIDTELGLTFGDIRNSLLVLRVIELENIAGPFLRTSLGRVEKDERT